jgi:hypothetical protein
MDLPRSSCVTGRTPVRASGRVWVVVSRGMGFLSFDDES